MGNIYAGRRSFKITANIMGADRDAVIDRLLEAATLQIEKQTRRLFVPKTQTRLYRYPPHDTGRSSWLWLDEDLISITTLQSKAQDASPTTIVAADYFLEPNNQGPPYNRIEIDLSSTAALESGATPQRSMSVAGSWGYQNATRTGGTVSSGLASDAAATSMVCSDASLIDVGDTLLIESEQVRITDQGFAALGSILVNDAGITADITDITITVDGSHGIVKGEVIRLDSEQMLVTNVSGNVLTVIRAWNGTVLASHADDTAVHINRTLTIVRAVNGTTAAVHANATAISVYDVPRDIVELCLAQAIADYHQEQGGWGRTVGAGDGEAEFSGKALTHRWKEVIAHYHRPRHATI